MDELFGPLLAYEMRTLRSDTSKREVSFKKIRKGKEEVVNEEDEEVFDVRIRLH